MDEQLRRSMLPLSGKAESETSQGDGQILAVSRPEGLEGVLAMAAADEGFAKALVEQREQALAVSGVELAATERTILVSVSDEALERMIANLDGAVADPQRRAALGKMERCVRRAIKRWTFPRSQTTTQVTIPFRFTTR